MKRGGSNATDELPLSRLLYSIIRRIGARGAFVDYFISKEVFMTKGDLIKVLQNRIEVLREDEETTLTRCHLMSVIASLTKITPESADVCYRRPCSSRIDTK
jgi:hypothetical protein